MSTMEAGIPRSAMEPPDVVQSVNTAGAMPRPREERYQSEFEEQTAPVEAPAEGQEGVDPVVAAVEETIAQDDENVAKADAHKVARPDDMIRLKEMEEAEATAQAAINERESGYETKLAEIDAAVESGEMGQTQAEQARRVINAEMRAFTRQSATEMATITAQKLRIEDAMKENVASYRREYTENPEFNAWYNSEEGQAVLNDPKYKALYGESPVPGYQAKVSQDTIQSLQAENASLKAEVEKSQSSIRAAGAPGGPLDKVSGVKDSPVSTQQTAKFNPKTDNLVDRLSRHFSA